MLRPNEDAVGQVLWARWRSGGKVAADSVIERDDGYVEPMDTGWYFRGPDDWQPATRQALRYVRGRVLDLGCGAGSHALHLQGQGHEVLGIDHSPLAIKVCRARGLKHAEPRSVTQVSSALGTFDTILMLGNNFGLMANRRRARWLLRRFASMTSPDACIIAQSINVYATKHRPHLAYHRRNRRRGRMGGQIRMRVRYQAYCSPWFDYLMVTPEEMQGILRGSPWRAKRWLGHTKTGFYTAVLVKRARS